MRLREAELKRLYAEHTSRRVGACIEAGELAMLSAGELPDARRAAVVAHLIGCSDCAAELQAMRCINDVVDAVIDRKGDDARPRILTFHPRATWRLTAAAASLAASALLAVFLWQSDRMPENIDTSARGKRIGFDHAVPADQKVVGSAPERLQWAAVKGAESYRVTLYDFESILIWKSRPVESTSVALPEEVRARLNRGGRWFWRVTAQIGLDRTESALFELVIEKTPERPR